MFQRNILPPSSGSKNKPSKPLPCHLLSRWYLAQLPLRTWRWRRYVPPKCRLTVIGIHSATSEKIVGLFITTTVRQSTMKLLKSIQFLNVLHHVDVDSTDNVSEVYAASVFRVGGFACCWLLGRSLLGSFLYLEDGGIRSSKTLVKLLPDNAPEDSTSHRAERWDTMKTTINYSNHFSLTRQGW
jgi:hypothetical protein